MSSSINFQKKISTSKVGLTATDLKTAALEKARVLRVFGQAADLEAGESQNGPYIKFKGMFQGINLLTGEVFRASTLFLPAVASDTLEGMLRVAKDENAGAVVQFGFDLGVTPNDKVGYEYYCENLLKSEKDPLEEMALALPVPKETKPRVTTPKKK